MDQKQKKKINGGSREYPIILVLWNEKQDFFSVKFSISIYSERKQWTDYGCRLSISKGRRNVNNIIKKKSLDRAVLDTCELADQTKKKKEKEKLSLNKENIEITSF